MKEYYLYSPDWVYLISIIYFFIFFVLLVFIAKYPFKNKIKNYYLIFILMAFHYFVILWDSVLNFVPFFPDCNLYSELIRAWEIPQGYPFVIINYFIFSYIPKVLLLFQPVLFILFNILLYVISIFFYFESWSIFTNKPITRRYETFIWLFLLCLPSSYLYIATPLREVFFLFSFSIFLYGLMLYYIQNKKIVLFLGLVLTFLFRWQFIVVSFSLVLVTIITKIKKNKKTNLGKVISVFLFFFIFYLAFSNMGYKLTPTWIASLRNYNIAHYSISGFTYGEVEWQNYFDIFKGGILLGLQFLLAPLPILHNINPLQTFTIFLDCLYILILLFFILLDIKKSLSKYWYWYFIISCFVFLAGIFEFYMPAAARHRLPVTIMLTFLALDCIDNKLEQKK